MTKLIPFKFKDYIAHLRQESGKTIADVARFLDVHISFISNIEHGHRLPPFKLYIKMLYAFSDTRGVNIDLFLQSFKAYTSEKLKPNASDHDKLKFYRACEKDYEAVVKEKGIPPYMKKTLRWIEKNLSLATEAYWESITEDSKKIEFIMKRHKKTKNPLRKEFENNLKRIEKLNLQQALIIQKQIALLNTLSK